MTCPPSNVFKNYLIDIFIYIKNRLIKCHPQKNKKNKKQIISTQISPKIKSQQQQHQCICVTVTNIYIYIF